MKIGYIGLGALGSQLARRFLPEHDLCVWDINPVSATALAALGVEVAPSAAELARRSDIVLLCLPRSSDVKHVVFSDNGLAAGLSAGKLIIDQTSGIPEETREMANVLLKSGIDMMDAAVSASPHIVAAGAATLMAAGSDRVFERAMPVLSVITETIYRCGSRVGDGQAMKMVNNAMNAACRLGTLEVVAMGRKAGLPLAIMADLLDQSEASNQTTAKMLPALVKGQASTNFSLSLMLKDVTQAVALGMSQRVPMPLTAIVRGLLQIGVNTLGENAQLEDMVGLIESMAGTRLTGDYWRGSPGSTEMAVPPNAADTLEQRSTAVLVESAIASLCRLITYECIAAGVRYGLALSDMALVINKSSGWSAAAKSVFAQLADGVPGSSRHLKAMTDSMQAACALGNRAGAPMLLANVGRTLLEQASNQIGQSAPIEELATLYELMTGARLTCPGEPGEQSGATIH